MILLHSLLAPSEMEWRYVVSHIKGYFFHAANILSLQNNWHQLATFFLPRAQIHLDGRQTDCQTLWRFIKTFFFQSLQIRFTAIAAVTAAF